MITGSLDSAELLIDDDGGFEIRSRCTGDSAGHVGIHLPSRKVTEIHRYRVTGHRKWMLFHDWENEQSPELGIVAVGREGAHPEPIDTAAAAASMRRVAAIVEGQMKFWNDFYDLVLEAHGDRNGDDKQFMPTNDLNAPARANIAAGGGQNYQRLRRRGLRPDADRAL